MFIEVAFKSEKQFYTWISFHTRVKQKHSNLLISSSSNLFFHSPISNCSENCVWNKGININKNRKMIIMINFDPFWSDWCVNIKNWFKLAPFPDTHCTHKCLSFLKIHSPPTQWRDKMFYKKRKKVGEISEREGPWSNHLKR